MWSGVPKIANIGLDLLIVDLEVFNDQIDLWIVGFPPQALGGSHAFNTDCFCWIFHGMLIYTEITTA